MSGTGSADFGRRDRASIWANRERHGHEIYASVARSTVGATLAAAIGFVLLLMAVNLTSGLNPSASSGSLSGPVLLVVALLLGAAGMGALWVSALALKIVMKSGPVLRIDSRRVIVRTGEGSVVLPWTTTEARLGAVFLLLTTAPQQSDPRGAATILVPVLLLEGGSTRLVAVLSAVRPKSAERQQIRNGPARHAAE